MSLVGSLEEAPSVCALSQRTVQYNLGVDCHDDRCYVVALTPGLPPAPGVPGLPRPAHSRPRSSQGQHIDLPGAVSRPDVHARCSRRWGCIVPAPASEPQFISSVTSDRSEHSCHRHNENGGSCVASCPAMWHGLSPSNKRRQILSVERRQTVRACDIEPTPSHPSRCAVLNHLERGQDIVI